MSTRLYLFLGDEWVPDRTTWVIAYVTRTAGNGESYNEITEQHRFATYDEAVEFLETHDSGEYRIVGEHPLVSPVPLEELDEYELVYSSPTTVAYRGDFTISAVEIFEYKPQQQAAFGEAAPSVP
jgi:hypothetical protein